MRTRILFLFITLFLMFGLAGGAYSEPFRGPWGEDRAERTSYKQASSEFNPLRSLVRVHRNYLSPVDGKTCPMYPSCSKYSLLCFKKHGLFIGWVMTCDRLLHEADEMGNAHVICINGVEGFHDPIGNNDFWWHSER